MKTFAILEGWAGGPYLTTDFSKEAHSRGLRRIKSSYSADILIAHSTGCYMLPRIINADLLLLIDPPFWPGESILRRWVNMNKNELRLLLSKFGYRKFIIDKMWEFYYILAKPSYTYSIASNQSHLDFLERIKEKNVILVRNTNDEFCSPKIKDALKPYANVKYKEIPGYHGDYYINPQPYIDLLLKEI